MRTLLWKGFSQAAGKSKIVTFGYSFQNEQRKVTPTTVKCAQTAVLAHELRLWGAELRFYVMNCGVACDFGLG